MMIKVDVTEGAAGPEGDNGIPGAGGEGGEGGASSQYTETYSEGILGGGKSFSVTRYSNKGKDGRRGKPGKPIRDKPGKFDGSLGRPGHCSFCIFNELGLSETAGSIYRLSFAQKQIRKLSPVPYTYKNLSPQDNFVVYGERVRFGPCSPQNVGGLSSPPCVLEGHLFLNDVLVGGGGTNFPGVPPSHGTKYGSIDASFDVEVSAPQLCKSIFHLHAPKGYPW